MSRTVTRSDARAPLDCYLAEINATALLTEDEEKELATRVAAGDPAARDRLARANLRLVVRIARQYSGKGLALEDLIAEGNVGLLRAVEGFDPGAGTRFSTYASYWVKQSIRVAMNKSGHAVRLPQYVGALLANWRKAEFHLRDELGRDPEPGEVATRLGLTKNQVKAVGKAMKAVASGRTGGEAGLDLSEALADGREVAPDDRLEVADDVRAALGSLDRLGAREATILRLRFGLGDEEPLTLKEIGGRLGLTRERVRQLEQDALAALRDYLAA